MNTQKKILIVAPYGFNDRMTNFIEFVTARLLAKNNWQVVALTRRENEKKSTDALYGIKIHRYRGLPQGIFFLLKTLIVLNPSIIHVHNLRNNRLGIITALLAKLIGTPLVFTEYGLLHNHYLTDDRDDPFNSPIKIDNVIVNIGKIFRRLRKDRLKTWPEIIKNYFFNWPLTHAGWVIFVSRHNLPIARTLGVKKALLLPQITDDVRWEYKITQQDEKTIKQNNLVLSKINQIDGRNILFIGQIKRRKGWDVLLKAIPYVPENIIKKFIFVTSSANAEKPELLALVNELGIAQRLLFIGQVFNSEILKKIYEKSQIVIIPSLYEGFGLVTLEAFEMKKPLIASAVEALTETIIDGKNGLLVPPNDPEKLAQTICRLAADQALAQKLVAGGKKTLARLKSDELKKQWLDFYDSLISK